MRALLVAGFACLLAATATQQDAGADRHSVRMLLRRAREQAETGDAAAGLLTLGEARRLAPNSEEVLFAEGQLALGAGTPLRAVLTLAPLARTNPGVAEYHYLLGVGLLQLGDLPAATDALQRSASLDSNRPRTLVALGLTLNSRKLYPEALSALRHALDLDPSGPETLAALAEAEVGAGDLAAAEAHAKRALAGGERAPARLALGMVRMQQERFAEARDELQRAAKLESDSSRIHYQLSLVLARLGDEAGSQAELELYRRGLAQNAERVKELHRRIGMGAE